MSGLASLKNIGAAIEKKLNAIDVSTPEELGQMGAKEAFIRLKSRYPNVCLVHLYTLQGAIDNMEYHHYRKQPSET